MKEIISHSFPVLIQLTKDQRIMKSRITAGTQRSLKIPHTSNSTVICTFYYAVCRERNIQVMIKRATESLD